MKPLLVRCYPAAWRARYGDEFEAILEERALGPFDVADILLGALDARLRLRGRGALDTHHGRGISMSLRLGGYAAILGGALLLLSIVIGVSAGVVGGIDPAVAGILLVTGSGALLVALTGLSAFQARAHPVLSWAAVAITALGTAVSVVGIVGMQLNNEGFWSAFVLGVLGVLVGSTLFAIATYRTAALAHGPALLLGVGSLVTIFAGLGGIALPPLLLIASAVAWFVLGIDAVRLDRPAGEPRPV